MSRTNLAEVVPGSLSAPALVAAALKELQAGRAVEAVACLSVPPPSDTTPDMARMIAGWLLSAGAGASALAWLDHAQKGLPAEVGTLVGRARVLTALGRSGEAIEAYAAAVELGCTDAAAHYEHGALLQTAARLPEAIEAFDTALRLRPAFPEALRAGAQVLRDLGHVEPALRFFGEALRLAPDDPNTLLDRTNLLHGLGRFDEAIADYDATLVRQPGQAGLLNNKGIALQGLGRLTEARAAFEAAVERDPGLAQGHLNLANALVWSGEPGLALASLDIALALRPAYPEALCCRGVALRAVGRFDDAMESFEAALAARPDFPHARANRGELRLLLGRFEAGWADYADRFRAGRQTRPMLPRPAPEWDGAQLQPGTRIAVLADQGNGDKIQFCRYLPLLVELGLDVTFVCPARLHRLLAPVTRAVTVVAAVNAEATFDVEIPLSNLPQAFRTGLDTIPARDRYLAPEPERVARWAARIGQHGFRIGLCWRGDQRWQADPLRSLPLACLAPLAGLPGVRLFSLQLPDNTGDDAVRFESYGIDPLGGELDTGPDGFCDTAAAMQELDLVITCDTSIAHLAGALGRPVWLALRAVPEWRWLLNRTDSPWYDSMCLFRQVEPDDWTGPVAAMTEVLRRTVVAVPGP